MSGVGDAGTDDDSPAPLLPPQPPSSLSPPPPPGGEIPVFPSACEDVERRVLGAGVFATPGRGGRRRARSLGSTQASPQEHIDGLYDQLALSGAIGQGLLDEMRGLQGCKERLEAEVSLLTSANKGLTHRIGTLASEKRTLAATCDVIEETVREKEKSEDDLTRERDRLMAICLTDDGAAARRRRVHDDSTLLCTPRDLRLSNAAPRRTLFEREELLVSHRLRASNASLSAAAASASSAAASPQLRTPASVLSPSESGDASSGSFGARLRDSSGTEPGESLASQLKLHSELFGLPRGIGSARHSHSRIHSHHRHSQSQPPAAAPAAAAAAEEAAGVAVAAAAAPAQRSMSAGVGGGAVGDDSSSDEGDGRSSTSGDESTEEEGVDGRPVTPTSPFRHTLVASSAGLGFGLSPPVAARSKGVSIMTAASDDGGHLGGGGGGAGGAESSLRPSSSLLHRIAERGSTAADTSFHAGAAGVAASGAAAGAVPLPLGGSDDDDDSSSSLEAAAATTASYVPDGHTDGGGGPPGGAGAPRNLASRAEFDLSVWAQAASVSPSPEEAASASAAAAAGAPSAAATPGDGSGGATVREVLTILTDSASAAATPSLQQVQQLAAAETQEGCGWEDAWEGGGRAASARSGSAQSVHAPHQCTMGNASSHDLTANLHHSTTAHLRVVLEALRKKIQAQAAVAGEAEGAQKARRVASELKRMENETMVVLDRFTGSAAKFFVEAARRDFQHLRTLEGALEVLLHELLQSLTVENLEQVRYQAALVRQQKVVIRQKEYILRSQKLRLYFSHLTRCLSASLFLLRVLRFFPLDIAADVPAATQTFVEFLFDLLPNSESLFKCGVSVAHHSCPKMQFSSFCLAEIDTCADAVSLTLCKRHEQQLSMLTGLHDGGARCGCLAAADWALCVIMESIRQGKNSELFPIADQLVGWVCGRTLVHEETGGILSTRRRRVYTVNDPVFPSTDAACGGWTMPWKNIVATAPPSDHLTWTAEGMYRHAGIRTMQGDLFGLDDSRDREGARSFRHYGFATDTAGAAGEQGMHAVSSLLWGSHPSDVWRDDHEYLALNPILFAFASPITYTLLSLPAPHPLSQGGSLTVPAHATDHAQSSKRKGWSSRQEGGQVSPRRGRGKIWI